MALSPDSLRSELADAEKRLEAIRKRRMQAEAEEKKVESECNAYRTLLGITPENPKLEFSDSGDSSESSSSEGKPSKRSVIRKVLSDAGTNGIAPAAIYKVVKSQGIARSYVHSTLFKMKESGQAKESNGKYAMVPVQ